MALGGSLAGTARVFLEVVDQQFHRDLARDQSKFRSATKDMEGDLGRVSRGALAGSGAMHQLGRSVAFASSAFLGGAGLTYVIKSSISAASDLNEQINKANVVFRSGAKEVKEFGETSARSFGIAEHEAIGMASTFGNMLVPMGFARTKAADMSVALVKLAADMASFNNADPSETLQALQSGLAGQVRPLRQYGVFLDQARIKAEAFADGIAKADVDMGKVRLSQERLSIAQTKYNEAISKYGAGTVQAARAHVLLQTAQNGLNKALAGSTSQLTAAQKAAATYQIILKDTKDAQGDFARTSGGLANQQRILRAEISDLEGKIGTALLPTVLSITKGMTGWLSSSENQARVQKDVTQVVDAGRAVFGAFAGVVRTANRVTGSLAETLKLLLALGVATKVYGMAAAFTRLAGTEAAAGAAGGTGIAGAAGKSSLLLRNLRALSAIGVITIAIELVFNRKGVDQAVSSFLDEHGLPGGTNKISTYQQWLKLPKWARDQFLAQGFDPSTLPGAPRGSEKQAERGMGVGGARQAQRTLPSSFSPTHDTSGLSGFPAVDIFASPGTTIGAPEDGTLTDPHFIPWNTAKRIGGWTIYFVGHDTGSTYFMTHFARVGVPGFYRKGQVIGVVAAVPGGAWQPHIHVGKHAGAYTPPSHSGAAPAAPSAPGSAGKTLKEGKPSDRADTDLIPKSLQLRLAKAELTKGYADDLAALRAIEDYLEERIKHEKNINKRIELLQQLKQTREDISGISEKQADARKKKSDAKTKAAIAAIDRVSEGIKRKIAELEEGGTETEGPEGAKTFKGTSTVRFNPKTGKYEVVKVKPDLDGLRAERDYILNVVLPDIDSKIIALVNAIKRLEKHPRKNKTQLAQMRAKLRALRDERKEIVALVKDLVVSIDELEAAISSGPEPEEGVVDRLGGQPSIPDEPGGASEESGGGDIGPSAPAGPTPEQIQQQIDAQTVGYLASVRELRSFQPNIANPAIARLLNPLGTLGGTTITVNVYGQQFSTDPFSWSKQIQSELQALVG